MNDVFKILSIGLIYLITTGSGMVPETSVVFVDEEHEGGSINVKNTDEQPSLLYTKIVDLNGEKDPAVIVTQPIVRVNAGQTQRVRLVLENEKPLKVEHLKRILFEGIPEKIPGKNIVRVTIRQDLPLIIRPKNLPVMKNPWTKLKWINEPDGTLKVINPSPYIVRLSQAATILPTEEQIDLTKSYILPKQEINLGVHDIPANASVKITPSTRYGYLVDEYITSITRKKT